jgi:hypothetical protein
VTPDSNKLNVVPCPEDITTKIALPDCAGKSNDGFAKSEKIFVYLLVSKDDSTHTVVCSGKGPSIKELVSKHNTAVNTSVWKLVAFVVGFLCQETAMHFQQRWEEGNKSLWNLQDKAMEGRAMCTDFGTVENGCPNLSFVIDWTKIDRNISPVHNNLKQPPKNVESTKELEVMDPSVDSEECISWGDMVMPFGKHSGLKFSEILKCFPGYIDWAAKLESPGHDFQRLIKYAQTMNMKLKRKASVLWKTDMFSNDKEVKKELNLASCRATTFMNAEKATNVNGNHLHELYQIPKDSVANPVGRNNQLTFHSKETVHLSMKKDTESRVSNFGMKAMLSEIFPTVISNLHFML